MRTLVLVSAILLSANVVMADSYPHPTLLIEPVELAKPDVAKQFVILDAREQAKYEQGHVPNAIWVDHAGWSKAFGDGDDAKGWSQRIAAMGIDGKSKIVVYDDNMSKDAARIWWILRYWGLNDVRLLNGAGRLGQRTPCRCRRTPFQVSRRATSWQSLSQSDSQPSNRSSTRLRSPACRSSIPAPKASSAARKK